MRFQGRAHKYGDDVNTDEIIPGRSLNTSDPEELAKHCMEDIDKEFINRVKSGDIIVAKKNFGCGSSREHAPIAIKTAGVSCVIASSFARIFYRNSINIGLPIFESKEASEGIDDGDEVIVDAMKGEIINKTKNRSFNFKPFPEFAREIISKGGLMPYIVKKNL